MAATGDPDASISPAPASHASSEKHVPPLHPVMLGTPGSSARVQVKSAKKIPRSVRDATSAEQSALAVAAPAPTTAKGRKRTLAQRPDSAQVADPIAEDPLPRRPRARAAVARSGDPETPV